MDETLVTLENIVEWCAYSGIFLPLNDDPGCTTSKSLTIATYLTNSFELDATGSFTRWVAAYWQDFCVRHPQGGWLFLSLFVKIAKELQHSPAVSVLKLEYICKVFQKGNDPLFHGLFGVKRMSYGDLDAFAKNALHPLTSNRELVSRLIVQCVDLCADDGVFYPQRVLFANAACSGPTIHKGMVLPVRPFVIAPMRSTKSRVLLVSFSVTSDVDGQLVFDCVKRFRIGIFASQRVISVEIATMLIDMGVAVLHRLSIHYVHGFRLTSGATLIESPHLLCSVCETDVGFCTLVPGESELVVDGGCDCKVYTFKTPSDHGDIRDAFFQCVRLMGSPFALATTGEYEHHVANIVDQIGHRRTELGDVSSVISSALRWSAGLFNQPRGPSETRGSTAYRILNELLNNPAGASDIPMRQKPAVEVQLSAVSHGSADDRISAFTESLQVAALFLRTRGQFSTVELL